jgi:protein arginine N-methyltransferase 1
MLRISDEVFFAWDARGETLGVGLHRRPEVWQPLSEAEFLALEAVVRTRGGGIPPGAATAALDGLLAAGIVVAAASPAERESYYLPMLYYHMFVDPLKTAAYLRALERRVRPGMRVLDVGAGVGIFSVAAAKLGARVWAVESRPILETARALAAENGVAEKIEFLRGDLFDPELAAKIGEVDLIVSEFIGDEIFDEEILLKTVWMRDLYLSGTSVPGKSAAGRLLPSGLDAYAVPFECDLAVNRHQSRLDRVRATAAQIGIRSEAVAGLLDREGLRNDFSDRLYSQSFREIEAEEFRFLGEPVCFHAADLETCDRVFFQTHAELPIERGGRLDGVLLYFVARLDGQEGDVRLSSAPWLKRTHWPQVLYLRQLRLGERRVAPGDTAKLAIAYPGGRGFAVQLV